MLRNQFRVEHSSGRGNAWHSNVGRVTRLFRVLSRLRSTGADPPYGDPDHQYQYAPGVKIPDDYARAFDPTGRTRKRPHLSAADNQSGVGADLRGKTQARAGDTTEKEPAKSSC